MQLKEIINILANNYGFQIEPIYFTNQWNLSPNIKGYHFYEKIKTKITDLESKKSTITDIVYNVVKINLENNRIIFNYNAIDYYPSDTAGKNVVHLIKNLKKSDLCKHAEALKKKLVELSIINKQQIIKAVDV